MKLRQVQMMVLPKIADILLVCVYVDVKNNTHKFQGSVCGITLFYSDPFRVPPNFSERRITLSKETLWEFQQISPKEPDPPRPLFFGDGPRLPC